MGIAVDAWIVEYDTTIAWVVAAVVPATGLLVSLVTPQKAAPPQAR